MAEWSPDGRWLAVAEDGLYRVATNGGAPALLSRESISALRFSRDGQSLYYSVITGAPTDRGMWKLSLTNRNVSRLTSLDDRRGSVGYVFATDDRYLYFTWREDDGDIWVMDVVTDVSK